MRKVILDGSTMTIDDVVRVARKNANVEIAKESKDEIIRVRKYI